MAEEKAKKTKRPTALKRDIRNERRRQINKSFKSSIRTQMRHFEDALKAGDKAKVQESLAGVYSVMDKAVKRGIYKLNKASRTKARCTARAAAV